jgi:hypothetical protein
MDFVEYIEEESGIYTNHLSFLTNSLNQSP